MRSYGWNPDRPDHDDHVFSVAGLVLQTLPQTVDLRQYCPPVYDQGQLGSCTANAIAAAIQFDQLKQKLPSFIPSRLFIYYNERAIEHSIPFDAGAAIKDGVKSVSKLGVCPESEWQYDISQFTVKPSDQCFNDAKQHKVTSYARVSRDLNQMKGCLASGYPFVYGFTVYETFESLAVEKTGVVPLPKHGEKILGGHAVVAVGYDDTKQQFICRNSWGDSWGAAGYFYMPYAYFTDSGLSSDFWTLRTTN